MANTAGGPGTPTPPRPHPSEADDRRGLRVRTGVNNDPNAQPDPKLRALEFPTVSAGASRRSLLHEGRRDASRRNVHRQRPHGRHRLGRGRQRRWIGHGSGDGTGARVEQPGRADRAFDSLYSLEQRGNGTERQRRVRRAAQGPARQGNPAGIRPISRSRNGSG